MVGHPSNSLASCFLVLYMHIAYGVVRSYSGGVAMCYVLPVLSMTSYFHIMAIKRRKATDFTSVTVNRVKLLY